MIDLIKLIENNGKSALYTGAKLFYLEMIGAPTTLTNSGQISHNLGPSYSINNDTEYLQPAIANTLTRKKSICESCGRIGQKADA